MIDGNPILVGDDLTIARGRRVIMRGFNFSVYPGDRIYIQGENGSGKTTIIESLLGLLPVSHGTISWLGEKRTPVGSGAFKNGSIAYLPQDHHLFENLTIYQNILMTQRISELRLFSLIGKIDQAMPGYSRLLDRLPKLVSVGQRQIAALLRVLICSPNLFVIDEPTAGISASLFDIMYCEFENMLMPNVSLIFTDQNIKYAEKIATKKISINPID